MTDLTERLIALRDSDPLFTNRADRDTLAAAANHITTLDALYEDLLGRSETERDSATTRICELEAELADLAEVAAASNEREKVLEAERDRYREVSRSLLEQANRYREALEKIASHDQPLDFDDMGCARAALNPEDDDDE